MGWEGHCFPLKVFTNSIVLKYHEVFAMNIVFGVLSQPRGLCEWAGIEMSREAMAVSRVCAGIN